MRFSFITAIFLISSCNRQGKQANELQAKIDTLQKQLAKVYRPGFGEFMSGIQTHHAKLWFAGINQNWALADFEIHEIKESIDAIREFCNDRPETQSIPMIFPAMDSVSNAIQQKNLPGFRNSFGLLTNTCNSCHKATAHEFNVVIIPTAPPSVNQDFKPNK